MNLHEKVQLKADIKTACLFFLQQRINTASQAMAVSQESANNQEKSSVGDKYETARAMGQIDRDMNAKQLHEAQMDYKFVEAITISQVNKTILPGTAFELNNTLFFVAVGLGSIKVNTQDVIVISYKSPLYEQLRTKKEGDTVLFKNKDERIKNLF